MADEHGRTQRRNPARGRKKRSPKQASQDLLIEQRREKVAKLRTAAWSIRDIAAHLKVSIGTVHSDIAAVFERTMDKADGAIERARAVSLERLDVATKGIWPEVESGDVDAIDRLVKVEARRSKLLGLDAPTKQELTGANGGPIDVSVAKASLAEKLNALSKRLNPGGSTGSESG